MLRFHIEIDSFKRAEMSFKHRLLIVEYILRLSITHLASSSLLTSSVTPSNAITRLYIVHQLFNPDKNDVSTHILMIYMLEG